MISLICSLAVSFAAMHLDEPDTDLVLRYYDLSSLAESGFDSELATFTLFPICTPMFGDQSEGVWELDEGSSIDAVAEVLAMVFEEEFEYEGRAIEFVPYRRIAVRGPEALHARIEAVLGFLEEAFGSYPSITIDVIPLTAPRPSAGAFVALAEADAWIARAPEQRRYTMQLRGDQPTLLEVSEAQPVLSGYQVEIAQGTAMYDPVVGVGSFGTRILARGSLADAGLFLSLVLGRGELLEDVATRERRVESQFATPNGVQNVPGAAVFQAPEVLNRSLALSTFVPAGMALVLETRLGLTRAERSEMIIIRQTRGSAEPVRELELADGGRLTLIDIGSMAPQQVTSYGPLLEFGSSPQRFSVAWQDDVHVLVGSEINAEPDFALSAIGDCSEGFWSVQTDSWLITAPARDAFDDVGEMLAAQARLRGAVEALKADPRVVDLSLRAFGAGVRSAASYRLALRPGTAASVVLGIEDMQVPDYEVEVAQDASALRPLVYNVLDGLALWVRASYGARGDLTLDVRGGAHLMRDKLRELDLQNRVMESIDQATYAHLAVHERITFRADDSAPWIAVLGDAAGKDGLRLEVEVKRP